MILMNDETVFLCQSKERGCLEEDVQPESLTNKDEPEDVANMFKECPFGEAQSLLARCAADSLQAVFLVSQQCRVWGSMNRQC